ncbi:MAG: protein-glutamate O-methyltransferase CheR [Pseudomonadota bacterium]
MAESRLAAINDLMTSLYAVTGTDLRGYKEETLLRRTDKRIEELHLGSLDAYRDYVRHNPDELTLLRQQLFVTVSTFFRDADAFSALTAQLRAALLAHTGPSFTVWVAGCGTGEEVYSLAMLLHDLLQQEGLQRELRLIGTDLNALALNQAEAAHYAENRINAVPAPLRERYLHKQAGQYTVATEIRTLCSFETADVFGPSVVKELDVVSCRNLLIYLKTPRQERLLTQLHQQLRPDGLLFLGQSESLAPAGRTLFASVDADHRIFRKRHAMV